MYEEVLTIIKWVLWSLSQRIPSKSCQTKPLLPERKVHTPPQAERNSNEENWWWLQFGTWETYVLLKDVHSFFLLSDFFDWQESLWGLSQNLRLTCYIFTLSLWGNVTESYWFQYFVMIVIINNYHVYHVVSWNFKIQKTKTIYENKIHISEIMFCIKI